MAVSRDNKEKILEELKIRFKNAKSIGFTTNTGLSVEEISNLRNALREVNSSYIIAKKTLIKLALKEVYNKEFDEGMLKGAIGVVFSNEDAVEGLGKVNNFVKATKGKKMEWDCSIFEGELKNKEETKQIAGLPSRETLLGRLVGSMMSPLGSLARFLDAAKTEVEAQGKENLSKIEVKKEEVS